MERNRCIEGQTETGTEREFLHTDTCKDKRICTSPSSRQRQGQRENFSTQTLVKTNAFALHRQADRDRDRERISPHRHL